ncbi:MAG: regulatory protein RecX [Oscillospiraceae bacterium]|nr:regulatory protein RecX [Oscillospiraceae bacterium]
MAQLPESAKKRALNMLERRDYSRKELILKLTQKGEPLEDAEAVADRMVELGVINDERYSRMLVRHYSSKGYGACRIKQELYRHGIHTDLWEEAMEEMPSQEEQMDKLFRSKLRSSDPDRAEIKKATDAMLRRGFSWSEISACKQRVLENSDTEEWLE